MEQIINLVTGCLVLRDVDEGEDSDDDGGDDLQWVGYKEVADLGRGKSLVPYERQKRITGDLIDLQTGRPRGVAGPFHFTDPWWQVTILRTKKAKSKLLEPKDWYSLCYRLRDDCRSLTDRVVHLFLSKLQDTLTEEDDTGTKVNISSWFSMARIGFETFLKQCGQYDDLDLMNLGARLEAYVASFPEDEQSESSRQSQFKNAIFNSGEFSFIKVAQAFPELLHYIPQLFPGFFKTIISIDDVKLQKLKKVLTENPGLLAFKAIISKKCNILGCETSYDALNKSCLLSKVPKHIHDAILMYEFIKKDTKENGHTYVHFSRILDVLSPVVEQFEEALEFLNKNNVTKTMVESGERHVFLYTLWMAENKIAYGIHSLIKLNEKQPWLFELDWDNEEFDSIRGDNDQLLAARLISSKPVVAISGKGGCGKTYVVAKVITAATAKRQQQTDNETSFHGDKESGKHGDGGDDSYEWKGDFPEKMEECPDKIELLLTAPTGKAANLLGKRAKCPSFTLHQVIYSYRNKKHDGPWKHEKVNTLVVDECSLVSVSTFSFLIQLLLENAQLRKIILLGDIRQLPSIEPGNFLSDTFNSLSRIGSAVELRSNHRAESKRIVDNATLISKKIYPEFYPEQFTLRKLPYSNPSSSGDDYTSQDISMEVMKLLNHDSLKDHVTSQFISFTRKVCDSINDLCCKRYSDHRTQEFGKNVFRTGDKICCSKNGYVNLYEKSHGIMTCHSQAKQKKVKEESQGGVERTVNEDEGTSLLGESGNQSTLNGCLDTTAADSSSNTNNEPSKPNQIRLCNGEIFFILEELETNDDRGQMRTFLQLSDKDTENEFIFWVDKGQIKKACQIKHAWARTIHTFQGSETDNVVYIVGNASWRQNWQHVYTAVTRGRKSVFIIGREDILRNAIKRSEIKRQTSLRKQLLDLLQKNQDFNTTQMSSVNITALQSSQLVRIKDNSCKQSMKIEMDAVPEETTLNNTQTVTDILSSLACEHDGMSGNSDIEEFDLDDSQSLFTKIKPNKSKKDLEAFNNNNRLPLISKTGLDFNTEHSLAPSGKSKQNKKYCDQNETSLLTSSAAQSSDMIRDSNNKVETRVEEEMESHSGQESDDSQSLISPPTTRARSRANEGQQNVQRFTNEEKSEVQFHQNNANRLQSCVADFNENKNALMKGRKNKKLSLSKGKMPLSLIDSQRVKTPLNVSKNRKYKYTIQEMSSPITPILNRNNFSPNIGNVQNTSSPLNTCNVSSDYHCHIVSGLSPLTPGYNGSLLGNKSVLSNNSMLNDKTSMTPSTSSVQEGKGRPLSELDAIKEPKSNESVQSQWSEIDESDYMKLADESSIHRSGVNDSRIEFNTSAMWNVNKSTMTQQLHGLTSVHRNRNSFTSTNVSTSSQWSEVDEEQYMTLDLEDISRMTFSYQDNRHKNNDETCFNDEKIKTSDNSKIMMDKSIDQDRQTSHENVNLESPELFEAGSPPSPSILETTPIKNNRKRIHETCASDNIEVSPLKQSFSQLKFQ